MSGDVQPRKRKDKKRKKDDLGVEEPRGTAALLGEGDVFMHSQHDHGTGGHWCAKIIFFSLLAVLITLIGLIILENRGLTELEANSVESRYSGVLEGWLEDAPEDDHHDEHTLELNHPDDEDDHGDEFEHNDEDEHDDHEDDHDDEHEEDDDDDDHNESEVDEAEDDEQNDSADDDEQTEEQDDQQEDEDSQEQEIEEDDDDDAEKETRYKRYVEDDEDDDDKEGQNIDGDDDEEGYKNDEDEEEESDEDHLQHVDDEDDDAEQNDSDDNQDDDNDTNLDDKDDDDNRSVEEDDDRNEDSNNEEEDDHEDEQDDDAEVELERIEREVSEEEPISTELPALPEESDDDDKSQEMSNEVEDPEVEGDGVAAEDVEDDEDFLEDDSDEPPIERITAPAGKPFVEVEEEVSSEQPPDTLAEEEEYEKRQEELRREEEQSSHMWLKLTVGGALLLATHAVVRRATAPRDPPETQERSVREETPLVDRRMTLIPEEPSLPAPKVASQESSQPIFKEPIAPKAPAVTKPPPPEEEDLEEEEDEKPAEEEDIEPVKAVQETEEKELYSDEEEIEEEEEEVVEEKKEIPQKSTPKPEVKSVAKPTQAAKPPEPEPDDDPDDVEIIDEEQLEDELEEEEDEEDISDVDDEELLNRLEAKYGRLPEPERPGQKHKDGGDSVEDEWPGEPSDSYWRQQLDSAEEELRQGAWAAAAARVGAPQLRDSARARLVRARAADAEAEAKRDNRALSRAITAYLDLLKMNERISDKKLLEITARTLDRIMFRGSYLSAEPVYRLLIRRFPNEPSYRNNLTISFLMANRADLAEGVLKETLQRWPNDRVALVHYGFVLKTLHNRLKEAVDAFQKALEGDAGAANEPRFYYHWGDALLLLGRTAEAREVHKRGAALGHFLSPSQRSLYNVPRLKSRPWWNIEETPYSKLARALEASWRDILKEGEAAKALYEKEKEGLKERGEWSQLDLFVQGQEIPGRCKRAPVTCSIVKAEPAAAKCRRGQIKFSAMAPGTRVRPHVGPTNCRLRMHLALSNTKDTFIRVDQTIREWQLGKVFMFDDSFEHEVWHNGTGTRLVLIVDVWHPALTSAERRTLPAI